MGIRIVHIRATNTTTHLLLNLHMLNHDNQGQCSCSTNLVSAGSKNLLSDNCMAWQHVCLMLIPLASPLGTHAYDASSTSLSLPVTILIPISHSQPCNHTAQPS